MEEVKDPIIARMESFASYPAGWDFGEGEPIRRDVIEFGKSLYLKFKCFGLDVAAIPDPEGGIWLTFGKGDLFFSVGIHSDLSLWANLEKGKGPNFKVKGLWPNVSISEIESLLPKSLGLISFRQVALRYLKGRLAKVWNACLPNTIDLHWIMILGRLGITPLEVSTDYDCWGGYRENQDGKYLPEFTLLEIEWHGKDYTGFQRRFLGYKLIVDWDSPEDGQDEEDDDEEEEKEYWYWHRLSILFFDFYFETNEPLKLKWEP